MRAVLNRSRIERSVGVAITKSPTQVGSTTRIDSGSESPLWCTAFIAGDSTTTGCTVHQDKVLVIRRPCGCINIIRAPSASERVPAIVVLLPYASDQNPALALGALKNKRRKRHTPSAPAVTIELILLAALRATRVILCLACKVTVPALPFSVRGLPQ